MSWFHPFSLEPRYKFELLGLLASLAVYNGLTLPVTFPLALYRKLLNWPVTRLEHIQDGWPQVAKGLQQILDWAGKDVEKTFQLSYDFGLADFGKNGYIGLDVISFEGIWPSYPSARNFSVYPIDWPTHWTSSDSESCSSSVPSDPLADVANDSTSSGSEPRSPSIPCDPLTDKNQVEGASGSASSESESRRASVSFVPSAGMGSGDSLAEYLDLPPSGSPNLAMRTPRNSLEPEVCKVTDQNRDAYVADHIFWLTERSVWSQYAAFARGFNVCVNPGAMKIFTPEALKRIVEGVQEINVQALQRATTYGGGYYSGHRVIINFWQVVHELPLARVKQLLEFVTASDRVPPNGIASIRFHVQRNGDDDAVGLDLP
jgi:hypothetical protein